MQNSLDLSGYKSVFIFEIFITTVVWKILNPILFPTQPHWISHFYAEMLNCVAKSSSKFKFMQISIEFYFSNSYSFINKHKKYSPNFFHVFMWTSLVAQTNSTSLMLTRWSATKCSTINPFNPLVFEAWQ